MIEYFKTLCKKYLREICTVSNYQWEQQQQLTMHCGI